MKNNEFAEDATRAKVVPQFNARISEELKHTIDTLGIETGKNKTELLDEFVRVYQTKQADELFSDMDLSKYDNLSNPVKESIHKAFIHILNTVNGNLSALKQEVIYIRGERSALVEKEETYKSEIEFIKSSTASEVLAFKLEKDELEKELLSQVDSWRDKSINLESKNKDLQKEFDNISKIADQVQIVTAENKELRESMRGIEANHKTIENDLSSQIISCAENLAKANQSILKLEFERDSKNDLIETLKNKLQQSETERIEASSELSSLHKQYSKALGKIEVLEKK